MAAVTGPAGISRRMAPDRETPICAPLSARGYRQTVAQVGFLVIAAAQPVCGMTNDLVDVTVPAAVSRQLAGDPCMGFETIAVDRYQAPLIGKDFVLFEIYPELKEPQVEALAQVCMIRVPVCGWMTGSSVPASA